MNAPENLVDTIIPEILYRILFGRRSRNKSLVNSILRRAWQEGYATAMEEEKKAMQPITDMERAEIDRLTLRETNVA